MKRKLPLIVACLLAFSGAAYAQDAHHPGEAAKSPATGPAMQERMKSMQEHMKGMRAQMEGIRSATDPKERERLMAEHMKTMEQSTSKMQGTMGCGKM
jgi:hypothetical protein